MKKAIVYLLCLTTLFLFSACSKAEKSGDSIIGTSSRINGESYGKIPEKISGDISASASKSQSSTESASFSDPVSQISYSSSQGDSSSSDQGGKPVDYESRLQLAFDGARIDDQAFIDHYISLGEYDSNAAEVAGAIYAAPNGNGDGRKDSPYSVEEAFDELKAGDTLYLRGGEYSLKDADGLFLSVKGTASQYVTIRNYPGERPVIKNERNGSEAYGIQLDPNACYIMIEGLEICSVTSKNACGIAVYGKGQNHVIIRNNHIHDIKTTTADPEHDDNAGANGILLLGENTSPISNFIIADNVIENNVTGWSESLSTAGNCEYIYVIGNTLDNNTNIGIDFYGNAKYCKTPALDQPRYCLAAFNKISRSHCEYADCAGLYVDGARDCLLQYNEISDSQYGIEIGSEERNDDFPVKNIVVRYNKVKNNEVVGIRVGGYESGSKTGYVTATEIYGNELYFDAQRSDGAEIIIAKCDGVTFSLNKIYAKKNAVVVTEFNQSVTKNVVFEDNVFYLDGGSAETIEFYVFGNDLTGLNAFNAIFGNNSFSRFDV